MTVPRAELIVDGTIYGGWTMLSVTRSLEAAAGQFHARLTERWPGQTADRPIAPGAACTVRLDGEIVLSGYVDAVSPGYDADGHEVTVTGRDRAGDLVDCAPLAEPGEWHGIGLGSLVAAIARPLGVGVKAATDLGPPLAKFRLQEGETAWAAIERACRARSVLCLSDSRGTLVLTRAGVERAGALQRGGQNGNILAARGDFDYSERYSVYVVKSQRPGRDDEDPAARAQVRAAATDREIGRYRPAVIVADQPLDAAAARLLAAWHCNLAAARSRKVTVTVAGWRDGKGQLWQPNRLTRIDCDWLRLAGDMLIATVRLGLDADGELTDLDLVRPDAYQPQPPSGRDRDEPGWTP